MAKKINTTLWAKKDGIVHISNGSTCLCGKYMLGNNYIDADSKPNCRECIRKHEETKTDTITT